MASSKEKGSIAELAVASDLLKHGYHVAFPFGDCDAYDLLFSNRPLVGEIDTPNPPVFDRVQVKYVKSNGDVIEVKARSHSVTAGKVTSTRYYGPDVAEWVAVYDATTDKCYYIRTKDLLVCKSGVMHLRLTPPKNGQNSKIRWASEYVVQPPLAL